MYIPGILFFCFIFTHFYCVVYDVYKYECIKAPMSCLFVCTLQYLIFIIIQTYRKPSNMWNACQIYSVECLSMIKSILSITLYAIYM